MYTVFISYIGQNEIKWNFYDNVKLYFLSIEVVFCD